SREHFVLAVSMCYAMLGSEMEECGLACDSSGVAHFAHGLHRGTARLQNQRKWRRCLCRGKSSYVLRVLQGAPRSNWSRPKDIRSAVRRSRLRQGCASRLL